MDANLADTPISLGISLASLVAAGAVLWKAGMAAGKSDQRHADSERRTDKLEADMRLTVTRMDFDRRFDEMSENMERLMDLVASAITGGQR